MSNPPYGASAADWAAFQKWKVERDATGVFPCSAGKACSAGCWRHASRETAATTALSTSSSSSADLKVKPARHSNNYSGHALLENQWKQINRITREVYAFNVDEGDSPRDTVSRTGGAPAPPAPAHSPRREPDKYPGGWYPVPPTRSSTSATTVSSSTPSSSAPQRLSDHKPARHSKGRTLLENQWKQINLITGNKGIVGNNNKGNKGTRASSGAREQIENGNKGIVGGTTRQV